MVNIEMKHDEEVELEDTFLPEDVEIESGEEEVSAQNKLQLLREKLAQCDKEKRTYLEDLARVRADFLNSKRRLEEQLARDKERSVDKLLFELLTLVDSFDTAMADKTLWETVDERWRVGVEAIHTKLLATLKSNNVTPLNALGQPFNPEEHEAISSALVSDPDEVDTVVSVLQNGFKRNDTILRPAKVVVGTE